MHRFFKLPVVVRQVPDMPRSGFSFVEIMIVTAILGFLAVAPFILLQGTRAETAIQDAKFLIGNSLERARSRATTGYGTSHHGVEVTSGAIRIFEMGWDEESIPIPPSVTIAPLPAKIIFKRLTGESIKDDLSLNSDVSITITNELGNSVVINVYSNGTIRY